VSSQRQAKVPEREPIALSPLAPVSVGELAERISRGDAWAEEAFYRRHIAGVRAVVRRLLGNSVDAEDVVQDAFVTAFEIWGQLRDPEQAGRWLLTIAIRKTHRRFRKRRLLRLLGLDRTTDDATLEALGRADATGEARAELALLDRALARVSAAERVAWMLRYVEGMSLDEIAQSCACSLATTKRRISAVNELVRAHIDLAEPRDD
jgi:RNA polymerase sigma-70 factor (ECF subfamily)